MKFDNQPDLQEIFTRAAFREIDNGHYESAKRLLKSAGIPLYVRDTDLVSFNLKYFFVRDLGSEEYVIPPNPAERPANYSFVDFVEAINAAKCVKAAELAKDLQFDREKAADFFVRLFDDKAFLDSMVPAIAAP